MPISELAPSIKILFINCKFLPSSTCFDPIKSPFLTSHTLQGLNSLSEFAGIQS